MVLGQLEIGIFEVSRPQATRMMGPPGQDLGVGHQGGHAAGIDESRELGGAGGRQLGPGLSHHRSTDRSGQVSQGITVEIHQIEETGLGVHGRHPIQARPVGSGAPRRTPPTLRSDRK